MAKNDKYVEKLSDFTDALGDLVDLLKEKEESGNQQAIVELMSVLDKNVIESIVKDLSEIKKDVKDLKTSNDKAIKAAKEERKKNETGMFGQIDDKKNKNTILDGVKTVILIAAGVLAIGMAFKIIGKVDFLSVISLGMGIMFVAMAFAKVASIKDDKGQPISYKVAIQTSIIMVIMSAAILASGLVMKLMPTLTLGEILTTIGVGLAMGLSTYFVLQGIGRLKPKDLLLAALVPILLPFMAMGIVGAGNILKDMPEVGIPQILSALGVSIALVPMALAFGFLAKGLSRSSLVDILFVGLAIPIMAWGIVQASIILKDVQQISLMDVIMAGLGVGLATLALIPTIFLLSKLGLTKNIAQLALAGLGIVIISTAISLSSWILSFGNYENYPSWEWALGAGLALIAFLPTVVLTGILVMSGIGAGALALGIIGTAMVAASIVAVSQILSTGTYEKYPSFGWAMGVGTSMLAFATATLTLGFIVMSGIGYLALKAGNKGMIMVIDTIVEASHRLSKGTWDKYPSFEWSKGVGLSLITFAHLMLKLGRNSMFSFLGDDMDLNEFIEKSTSSLILAGQKFSGAGDIFSTNYPKEDWAKGVGGALVAFAEVMNTLKPKSLTEGVLDWIKNYDFAEFIDIATTSLIAAGKKFTETGGDYFKANYPSEEWALGVGGSLVAFATVMEKLKNVRKKFLKGDNFKEFIEMLSETIISSGQIFTAQGSGLYDLSTVPSEEWAKNVGGALTAFSSAIEALRDIKKKYVKKDDYLKDTIGRLIESIVYAGQLFKGTGDTDLYNPEYVPDESWSQKVGSVFSALKNILSGIEDTEEFRNKMSDLGMSLYIFSTYLSKLQNPEEEKMNLLISSIENIVKVLPKQEDIEPFQRFVEVLNNLSNVPFDNLKNVSNITNLISKLTDTIDDIDINKVNSLFNLSAGLQMLGLVDNEKLSQTLMTIQNKGNELKSVFDTGGNTISNMLNNLFDKTSGGNEKDETIVQKSTEMSLFEKSTLATVKNIDKNLVIMFNPIAKLAGVELGTADDTIPPANNVQDGTSGKVGDKIKYKN